MERVTVHCPPALVVRIVMRLPKKKKKKIEAKKKKKRRRAQFNSEEAGWMGFCDCGVVVVKFDVCVCVCVGC